MGPLANIRIADFTIHAAGPFCTHMLSQLGAECIKIESRSRPDAFRKPHAVYGRMEAATFDQVSANKLSVRLNLKNSEGVALAKRLVELSDVTAESFRPGVMRRLGLDFAALREVKPDLVMLSLSASGQTGPDSHFAGYAPLFGAWGGLGWMSGYTDGPPVEMRHVMDHTAGMHAALAVVAALHQRKQTGRAQHVDLAAREIASAMVGDALLQASCGESPVRPGNAHPGMSPHGVFATRENDRWLTIAVRSDDEWRALTAVLGHAEAGVDPRYATNAGRLQRNEEVESMVMGWLSGVEAGECASALQAVGVAAHVSWTIEDLTADAHMRQRGAITVVASEGLAARAAIGPPARFSATADVGIRRLTPTLGQDEDYVFGELLGLSSAARRALEEREVIY